MQPYCKPIIYIHHLSFLAFLLFFPFNDPSSHANPKSRNDPAMHNNYNNQKVRRSSHS